MISKLSHEEIKTSKPSVEDVKGMQRTPFCLIMDNIRSLYNVGAMFRTSDAVLADKIYMCGITGYPPRKEIDKVALGAVEVVPWEFIPSTKDTLVKLKEKGVKIYALELTKDSVDFKEAKYEFPMALIVGNEVEGISEDVMPFVDEAISIPMLGRANSLNVATAYGIVAYEILYQFKNGKHSHA
jgi:tRNA G18 (ribose-2'-O)-methylase SpoU